MSNNKALKSDKLIFTNSEVGNRTFPIACEGTMSPETIFDFNVFLFFYGFEWVYGEHKLKKFVISFYHLPFLPFVIFFFLKLFMLNRKNHLLTIPLS